MTLQISLSEDTPWPKKTIKSKVEENRSESKYRSTNQIKSNMPETKTGGTYKEDTKNYCYILLYTNKKLIHIYVINKQEQIEDLSCQRTILRRIPPPFPLFPFLISPSPSTCFFPLVFFVFFQMSLGHMQQLWPLLSTLQCIVLHISSICYTMCQYWPVPNISSISVAIFDSCVCVCVCVCVCFFF